MSDPPNNIHPLRSSRSPKKTTHFPHDTSDPFSLDDGTEYSIDTFYVGSRDRDKESITVAVPIPRGIMAQIEAIIQQRRIKHYKTKQDLIRDAVYHRFHYIKNLLDDPQMERSLRTLLAEGELERRMADIDKRDEILSRFEEGLNKAMVAGDRQNLGEILVDGDRLIEMWPACGARERLAALIDRYRRIGQ